MPLVATTIQDPGESGLRSFGYLIGGMVGFLFGLGLPWLFGFSYPKWPWFLGALLVFFALARPAALRPIYFFWMRFGLLMSRITTPLILGLVFFAVLLPTGLIAKLFRADPMARKFDNDAQSYRIESKKPSVANLEKPF